MKTFSTLTLLALFSTACASSHKQDTDRTIASDRPVLSNCYSIDPKVTLSEGEYDTLSVLKNPPSRPVLSFQVYRADKFLNQTQAGKESDWPSLQDGYVTADGKVVVGGTKEPVTSHFHKVDFKNDEENLDLMISRDWTHILRRTANHKPTKHKLTQIKPSACN